MIPRKLKKQAKKEKKEAYIKANYYITRKGKLRKQKSGHWYVQNYGDEFAHRFEDDFDFGSKWGI